MTATTPRSETTTRSAAIGTQIGGVAALLGSLAFISTVASSGDLTPRESFLLPVSIAGCAVAAVGLALLIAFAPRLLDGLPRWAVVLSTAALVVAFAVAWAQATIVPALADLVTDDVFDKINESSGLIVFMIPKSILGLVGFGTLAIAGLRSGALPKAAAILLGLGALAFVLPPFPPGLVLISIGLILAARR